MEFIRIRSSADFLQFDAYRPKIHPDTDPIEGIVWHYNFRPGAKCGLCGRHHFEGRIVRLKNGGHSNIGHICGQKWGNSWFQAERDYEQRVLRPALLKKLSLSLTTVSATAERAADIGDRGAALARRKRSFRTRFPRLFAELTRRAGSLSGARITETKERSADEIDEMLAINSQQSRERLRYYQTTVTTIDGLPFISASVHALTANIATRVAQFRTTSFEGAPIETLLDWERWLHNLNAALDSAETVLAHGERFFTQANLQKLSLLAQGPERTSLPLLRLSDLDSADKPPLTSRKTPMNRKARRAAARSYL